MEFDQVIAPLDRKDFLAEHWEKSWLHVPGRADRFGDLLSWDDLNAILENTRIAPPHIHLSQTGESIAPERYVQYHPGDRADQGASGRCAGPHRSAHARGSQPLFPALAHGRPVSRIHGLRQDIL